MTTNRFICNSVVFTTKNVRSVILAVFTPVTEALDGTKRYVSKTNKDTQMKLELCGVCKKVYLIRLLLKSFTTSIYITFVGWRTTKWKFKETAITVSPTYRVNFIWFFQSPAELLLMTMGHTKSHYHSITLANMASVTLSFHVLHVNMLAFYQVIICFFICPGTSVVIHFCIFS
jgi:hypothetical protein